MLVSLHYTWAEKKQPAEIINFGTLTVREGGFHKATVIITLSLRVSEVKNL